MGAIFKRLAFTGILLATGVSGTAAPGDTVEVIPAPYTCTQGITFDGSYLWAVDRLSDLIYKLNPADGSIEDSIPAPGYVPRGLTWDGEHLWCIDAEEERIYAINPVNRLVQKTIWCPVSRPTGLAWDGKYLWIADDGDNKLHQISSEDGTTIKSFSSPASTPCGLTFDGTYLWVSDRIRDMIYMVYPQDGSVIIAFPSPGPYSWGLAWDGTYLWNADYQTDRIYKLVTRDDTPFTRFEGKNEQMTFIHQVRNFGPDSIITLDVYLAVPENRNNQELLGDVVFDPAPAAITEDKWGQEIAQFRFDELPASDFVTVTMTADATLYENRYFIFPEKVGTLDDIPAGIRDRYLIDDTKFSMENPVIQKAVKAAVGGETNPYWIARNIFNYVIAHMEYELAGGWNIAPTVLERGNGSCSEYSFVYISMCRAAGLPARYVGSVVIRGDDASYDDVFHRWVEVYLPNYGWIPVDPSGGDDRWPADQANAFGFLTNRFLITTAGGGGSEYLEWGYNANERWTSRGRCKIVVENFGEWTPLDEK
jgi:transglutaminase-like putative cysteine protease